MNRKATPPKIPLRFFRWYCHQEYQEDIEGDLMERFEGNVKENGIKAARWRLFKDVVKLFRPGIIRPLEESYSLNHYDMLRSHLTIAFRIINREWSFSLINITGLAIGLMVFISLTKYIQYEYSYDHFHQDKEKIFRVVVEQTQPNGTFLSASTPPILGKTLKENYPQVKEMVRISMTGKHELGYADKSLTHGNGIYADPSFFSLFTFPLSLGQKEIALQDNHSIVINQQIARQHFGNEDPIGKEILLDEKHLLTVTGVLDSISQNSHLQFNYIIPIQFYNLISGQVDNNWWNFFTRTYIKLNDPETGGDFENQIANIIHQNYVEEEEEEIQAKVQLQPLLDIYLYSNFDWDTNRYAKQGSPEKLYLFLIIAVIILVLASFNLVNLSTAKALKRAKEVGVRKVNGATRKQLIIQFLTESTLTVFLAMALALILGILSEERIEALLSIEYANIGLFETIVRLLFFTFLLGGIAGIYPAFVLSSFRPSRTLKGIFPGNANSFYLRKALTIIQFSLSLLLIIGALVVTAQLNFMQKKDLGYNQERIIHFNLNRKQSKQYQLIKKELEQIPAIKHIAASSAMPHYDPSSTFITSKEDAENIYVRHYLVDHNLRETLQIPLLKGRDFSEEIKSDTMNFIVNQAAAEALNMTDPIGKELEFWGQEGKIIGVVGNFHFNAVNHKIEPLIFRNGIESNKWLFLGNLVIRLRSGWSKDDIAEIAKTLKVFGSKDPTPLFLEDSISNLYRTERKLSYLMRWACFLTLFIALLGLYGLVIINLEHKQKEIGIRKVLGAEIKNLLILLSKNFVKLMSIAFIISVPVSYYITNEWLTNYAYRIDLGWKLFFLPFVSILLITSIMVSYQSIKAALANPIKSLKND